MYQRRRPAAPRNPLIHRPRLVGLLAVERLVWILIPVAVAVLLLALYLR